MSVLFFWELGLAAHPEAKHGACTVGVKLSCYVCGDGGKEGGCSG